MVKGREKAACCRRKGMTNTEHDQNQPEQRAALQGAESAWKTHVFPDPAVTNACAVPRTR